MRWFLRVMGIFLVLVILLIGAVWIAGSTISKGHTVSRSASLNVPPDSVWQVLTDYAGYVSWRSELTGVVILPQMNGRVRWKETNKYEQVIAYEVVEALPSRRLGIKISDEGLPFGGTWTIKIQPEDHGSSIEIIERGVIKSAPMRLFFKLFFSSTATIDIYLKDLGKRFSQELEF